MLKFKYPSKADGGNAVQVDKLGNVVTKTLKTSNDGASVELDGVEFDTDDVNFDVANPMQSGRQLSL